MRSMLMLLPEGPRKGNENKYWEEKFAGTSVPNVFPAHNDSMRGNFV